MIFNLTTDSDGTLTGCGLSGAAYVTGNNGLSIRKSKQSGSSVTPNGFYHPFMNTQSNGGGGGDCSNPQFPTGSDATGSYYIKDCDNDSTYDAPVNNFAQEAQWYIPDLSSSSLATTWVTEQTGTLVSRQCVSQNAEGVYAIDTTEITENAGFELIDSEAADFADYQVAAPDLSGLIDFTISN